MAMMAYRATMFMIFFNYAMIIANYIGTLIFIILLAGSFGGFHSGFGGILTAIVALLLEVVGLFRPLGDSDPDNLITMGITGGLLFLSVLYFLQHKEKGG